MTEAQLADLGMWVGALLTLMIFSFLYKDNPFYKFAEHLFVGVSAAYWMVQGFWATLMPNLLGKIWPASVDFAFPGLSGAEPKYTHLIALVFGLLLMCRLIPPIAVYARMAMSMVIGFAAGTNLTRYLASDFVSQIDHTMRPLVVTHGGFSWGGTINNLVLVLGVVSGLVYFFFSAEHKGILGKTSRVGIWVLMVSFGAAFGYTVMARISLLTGRMEYLRDWVMMVFGLS